MHTFPFYTLPDVAKALFSPERIHVIYGFFFFPPFFAVGIISNGPLTLTQSFSPPNFQNDQTALIITPPFTPKRISRDIPAIKYAQIRPPFSSSLQTVCWRVIPSQRKLHSDLALTVVPLTNLSTSLNPEQDKNKDSDIAGLLAFCGQSNCSCGAADRPQNPVPVFKFLHRLSLSLSCVLQICTRACKHL